jgi:exonuclease SbcD
VRFLHTADWHIGKTLRGRDRLDEQYEVVRQIIGHAREHQVDAVLIAGDLYDSAAPTAKAQQLVVRALLALRDTGAKVLAIAGNHDNAATFDAYGPLMDAVDITLVGRVRPPADGGIVRFDARSTGERVNVAVLPFLSQRYAVKAAQLVASTPAEMSRDYDAMVREVIESLAASFTPDAVNVMMAHLTVVGGAFGGGERRAQSIFDYHVPAAAFPADAHYVALGHLHRRQRMDAPCPVHYSGSPLAVDFGEQDNIPVVCLVEVTPTTPARITDLAVTAGRRLRTVHGTVDEIISRAAEFGDDYLRVYLREGARAGLREEITDALPGALEVRIDPEFAVSVTDRQPRTDHRDRSPADLFADFCAARGIADERVQTLFGQLHDEVTGAGRE